MKGAIRTVRGALATLGVLLASTTAALCAPVLMISIDGLRPADVTDASARGISIPTLSNLANTGAYADRVIGVLPTLTYPSHTTLITGVAPARHGVANNLTFDPQFKNQGGWYWYAEDIKAATLWQAAHAAGLRVANVHWPVSVGAPGIDDNLPQLWRTGLNDDRKLNRALATRGLTERLEREVGMPYADGIDESVEGDETRARFAEVLIRDARPDLATVYLTGLDHVQHLFGPGTPQAHEALRRIDAAVGRLVAAARAARPEYVVVIVSDHGFAPVATDVNLYRAFADAGLLTLDPGKKEVTGWEAAPWFAGGAAQVVLARPGDAALRAKVEALLNRLKSDSALGVADWMGRDAIAALGGASDAQYVISFKIGWEMAKDPFAPLVGPSAYKGMHGYPAAYPEMWSTFIVSGPGLKRRGSLGQVDMRDIAPTVAGILNVDLPGTEGKPVF